MPVFISHRTADNLIAATVANRLRSVHRITCYVDDIDTELAKARGTASVTKLLVSRLHDCTNLLAIVTQNTKGSWWVPFEVGVAREAPRAITSFTDQIDKDLPEFLLEWPRLRGDSAVDTFARLYKEQKPMLTKVASTEGLALSDEARSLEIVGQFHARLKVALGQS